MPPPPRAIKVTDEHGYGDLLQRLIHCKVEFVLIGGLAAIARGSNRATFDIDVVYERSAENMRRLVDAIGELDPYLRGAPPGLPFVWELATIQQGLNFTLTTRIGDIDLLGEAAGDGRYESVFPDSTEIQLFGQTCRCVTVERLIALKRAAGRPKDFETIAELEAIRDEHV